MKEECLICKAPLEYLQEDVLMECSICHKSEYSKTRCLNGHYVCNECHSKGVNVIVGMCLEETSCNPVEIIGKMMDMSFCHMHGPEHHIMVGAALLTAYHNAGGKIDLQRALSEMISRGSKVPGGACGFWGACGAAISTGMFISIITGSTPLMNESWGHSNLMTSRALASLGEIGGPRCCKRNSYMSILAAIDYAEEITGVKMQKPQIVCRHKSSNSQCIGHRCPFYPSKRYLVLCTGNRCRSQMAHGILKHLHPEAEVCSAGVKPAAEVHPLALKVMAEIGIDISSHYPKNVSQYLDESWDYVITVCGGAKENCPTFVGEVGQCLHIGFDDPDAFTGPEEQIIDEFRRVRDEIYREMKKLSNVLTHPSSLK